jgi:hypothetical protein
VSDLAQQIRERLDGWAPPAGDGPPPQFVEILDPGDLTQEQIEDWQRRWDDVMVTADDKSLHILASAPRFYPGFEQMRAALLAVLDLSQRCEQILDTAMGPNSVAQGAEEVRIERARNIAACRVLRMGVREIAKELGIEVEGA